MVRFARRSAGLLLFPLPFLLAASGSASAAENPVKLEVLLPALIGVLAVATVVEFALSVLFQWRVYRILAGGRAMKTLITVLVCLIVVSTQDYNLFGQILHLANAIPKAPESSLNWASGDALMSALILAGGSSGINKLIFNLGLRKEEPIEPAKPPKDDSIAWISVQLPMNRVDRDVRVFVTEIAAAGAGDALLAGTIDNRSRWQRVSSVLSPPQQRFPLVEGYTVKSKTKYRIELVNQPYGLVATGPSQIIYEGAFAPRAVVDFFPD
jgi:hypothetical protein